MLELLFALVVQLFLNVPMVFKVETSENKKVETNAKQQFWRQQFYQLLISLCRLFLRLLLSVHCIHHSSQRDPARSPNEIGVAHVVVFGQRTASFLSPYSPNNEEKDKSKQENNGPHCNHEKKNSSCEKDPLALLWFAINRFIHSRRHCGFVVCDFHHLGLIDKQRFDGKAQLWRDFSQTFAQEATKMPRMHNFDKSVTVQTCSSSTESESVWELKN